MQDGLVQGTFKTILNPGSGAQVMGAYSPGIKLDMGAFEMFLITGQIAMDLEGNAIAPGNIAKQTEYIYQSIEKILTAGGASLDDVVKAVIYMTDISKFSEFSAIRTKYLSKSKPASTCIQISKTVKEGCEIEIEVIAVKKKLIQKNKSK